MHAPEPAPPQLPAWLRRTRGEHRRPAALAVVVAIGLQLVLPDRMVPQVRYLLLALEGALLGALVVANPFGSTASPPYCAQPGSRSPHSSGYQTGGLRCCLCSTSSPAG
jgi:hypothetical protein